jgi:hypothetical protein
MNAFAYLTTTQAPLYRAIVRVFVESNERFLFHLRLQDVVNAVGGAAQAEVAAALAQLCAWGNLQTTDAHTYNITTEGEAAERALAMLEAYAPTNVAESTLVDIHHALEELRQVSLEAEPNSGRLRRSVMLLRTSFLQLTDSAQALLRGLERRDGLEPLEARRSVEDAERFIAGLVLASESIAGAVRQIETAGFEASLPPALWQPFRNWFVSQPGRPSNAQLLRERARAAIPELLAAMARMRDQRLNRIDRSKDFRVLARWFANAESDDEAHRLWRSVFGLTPARHLLINDATLDDYEAADVGPDTSWLDAPPLRRLPRCREPGNGYTPTMTRIIDRTAEKEKLAAAIHEEALRLLNAQTRFGIGRRMRLSELEDLESGEFDLLLDVLSEAVSARVLSSEAVEVVSGNGCLKVTLEPTRDGREAAIPTTDGVFSGPDCWLSIEPTFAEEMTR